VTGSPQDPWAEIERLLDQVLDAEPDARPELLARIHLENPDIAGEVERLVQAITADEQFLQDSAPNYAAPLITRLLDSNDLTPGTRLGGYEIISELGRGGTATVYLAHDRKHGRRVAVKVPHVALASILGPERFLREIQIAAQLQHPNILPLHDSGEVNGVLYYVMPYVEGESLRDRLSREGELPIEDALHIARQVADALAYAHAHGIVHRDIKPENILLSGGHALVADFGIARAITLATGERQHETGPLGTVLYMSPEQAAADPRLDGRSDIYSLGCVLYEMLVGQAPFDGTDPQAVRASHLLDPIPDARVLRPTIPAELKQVIDMAMAKHPGDRYARATEFLAALERASARAKESRWNRTAIGATLVVVLALALAVVARVAPGISRSRSGAPPEVPRIAVLYFQDLSPDSSLRRVADRITEDLIYELSGVKAFRVISSNGVQRYRGRRPPLDSMSTALGVNTFVDGSVQPWGEHLRLRVQLIDASSNTYMDSLSLERRMTESGAFEQRVAQEIAAALRQQLGRQVRLRGILAEGGNPPAKSLLLKAQRARDDADAILQSPHVEDLRTAGELLRGADSLLALAHAADTSWLRPLTDRSWTLHQLASLLEGDEQISARQAALRLAEEAVRRHPNAPAALELRGSLRLEQVWQQEAADSNPALVQQSESDLRTALDADSTRAKAWATLSFLLWYRGRTAEAEIAARRALSEDSYMADAPAVFDRLYFANLMLGQFREAAEWCTRGRLSFHKYWRFVECALTLMRHDRQAPPNPDSAWALVRELDRLDPAEKAKAEGRAYHPIYRRVVAATISARAGKTGFARGELGRAIQAAQGDSTLTLDLAPDEALLRLALGDRRRAADLVRGYLEARPTARDYFTREPLFKELQPLN
jgi:serine/threonine-protein kinase